MFEILDFAALIQFYPDDIRPSSNSNIESNPVNTSIITVHVKVISQTEYIKTKQLRRRCRLETGHQTGLVRFTAT